VTGWYLQVALYRDGSEPWRQRVFKFLVHQLVLRAFGGPPPTDSHEVRHLNGNGLDNRISNLRWGTRQENVDDRADHGTNPVGARNPNSKFTIEDVILIRSSDAPAEELAAKFGVWPSAIHRIRTGARWKHLPGAHKKATMDDRVRGPDGTFIGTKR
jgi:hypothetical protein